MGIGGSIFLLALGAILTFAVHGSLGFLDVHVVGWVLMAAGVLGLILTLFFYANRRRRVVSTSGAVPAARYPVSERTVVDEPLDGYPPV